ncbi:XdhC family protein [Cohnella nanjingensis]|uniref:XdhC family protein n=1 Tax=Cohnella nanjingensis TaxID=1387779 RepID=A0A7X0RXG9_9BACL|nr:XdhC/CoxI family protein [Cohnella nanjingensis]MBB6675464.1 XdhC family protein [Cohnella nanjingensis]
METFGIVDRALRCEGAVVLATVIGVKGHAYRKPGAAMLFLPESAEGRIGSISPGCLESDLQARAAAVWASGECEIVRYDMRPETDAMWGEAIGCGGVIEVLLEAVSGELRRALAEARSRAWRGVASKLVRERRGRGIHYRLAEPGRAEPGASGAAPLFEWRIARQDRLVLFGAGTDADPVYRLAAGLGFRVAVADWRQSLLTTERFPDAELASGGASELVRALGIGEGDYVVVCGHQLQRDRAMIEALLPLRPAYVGVMGSARRIRHLFDGLPMPDFVKAPVGLPIGAEGPEEIAVSIAAELIAVRRGRRTREARESHADYGSLSGGRPEQPDGAAQAVPGACPR